MPFCLIDPRFGGNAPDMDFSYLLEEYVARGCKGMGEMLPKMAFDDPRCLNLFRQAGKFGLPIIFDMNDNPVYYGLRDDPGLPRLERALQECPETTLVGHGPTFWAEISGDLPRDLSTFMARFGTDQQCRDYLLAARWPQGFLTSRFTHPR